MFSCDDIQQSRNRGSMWGHGQSLARHASVDGCQQYHRRFIWYPLFVSSNTSKKPWLHEQIAHGSMSTRSTYEAPPQAQNSLGLSHVSRPPRVSPVDDAPLWKCPSSWLVSGRVLAPPKAVSVTHCKGLYTGPWFICTTRCTNFFANLPFRMWIVYEI